MAAIPEKIETIVTSTRLRLARNLAAYPFPSLLKGKDAEDVLILTRNALGKLDKFREYDMWKLGEEEAMLLQEQHLISPALRKKKEGAAAFISTDTRVSVMVGEEDHLREQYIMKGYNLYPAYERISGLDDGLSRRLNFAYDSKLGYLTACPTNLGTGMRASVMMFLPGLSKEKEIERLLPGLKQRGMTVRGVFGEGSAAEGFTYQVSNDRTLGVNEKEILENLDQLTQDLCHLEIRARERMLEAKPISVKDGCLRAYGVLTNCARLSHKELTEGMIQIQLGIALGFFEVRNTDEFTDFLSDMRPASFRLENGLRGASEEECNLQRAEIMGKVLPELVVKV